MSQITTRPKINSVSSTLVSASILACIGIAWKIGKACVESRLSAEAQRSYGVIEKAVSQNHPEKIISSSRIQDNLNENLHKIDNCLSGVNISEIEKAKIRSLSLISSSPAITEDKKLLENSIKSISQSGSISQINKIYANTVEKLKIDNTKHFITSLETACLKAAENVKFNSITSISDNSGNIRIIAEDKKGRAIVSEITALPGGDVKMESEVHGVTDGSCNEIMDNFDLALEKSGVESNNKDRKFTGGVCRLSAAMDFVNRKLNKIPYVKKESKSSKKAARTRLLNQIKGKQNTR